MFIYICDTLTTKKRHLMLCVCLFVMFIYFILFLQVLAKVHDHSTTEESSGTTTAMARQLILYAILATIYVVQPL